MAVHAPSFPARIDQVSIAWLNQVLDTAGVLGSNRVTNVQAGAATTAGRASSVHVLTLDYEHPGGEVPRRIVVKFPAENPLFRNAAAARRSYQREVDFYRHFAQEAGIPVPRCYAAEHDPQSDSFVLLLEHVDGAARKGVTESTIAEVDAAVKHLAAFHSRWWDRPQALKGILLEYGPQSQDEHVRGVLRALDRLPAEARDQVGANVLSLLERWLRSADRIADHCLRGPLTMCHGSFHYEQLLHPPTAGGAPHVVDWQSVCIDCGPSDLARLLVTSLSPELRRRHETRLVDRYQAHLHDAGIRGYETDRLWNHYRLGVVKILVLHVQVFAIFDPQVLLQRWQSPDTSPSMWTLLFGWPGQAAEDHDVAALLERLGAGESA